MGSVLSTCTTCIEDCMKREREEEKEAEGGGTTAPVVQDEKGSPEKKSKSSLSSSSVDAVGCSDIACFGAGCYWFAPLFMFPWTLLHEESFLLILYCMKSLTLSSYLISVL